MSKFENEKFFYDRTDVKEIEIGAVRTKIYRIISKINFPTQRETVVEGTKGGYCALGTLSEQGNCWVDKFSVVGPDCFVADGAYVERSLLAHDCTISGRSLVFDSQIIPKAKAALAEKSKVLKSKIKGDLNLKEEASIVASTVNGNLKMESNSQLLRCDIKTEKMISVVGNKRVVDAKIEGFGTIGISESISIEPLNLEK